MFTSQADVFARNSSHRDDIDLQCSLIKMISTSTQQVHNGRSFTCSTGLVSISCRRGLLRCPQVPHRASSWSCTQGGLGVPSPAIELACRSTYMLHSVITYLIRRGFVANHYILSPPPDFVGLMTYLWNHGAPWQFPLIYLFQHFTALTSKRYLLSLPSS